MTSARKAEQALYEAEVFMNTMNSVLINCVTKHGVPAVDMCTCLTEGRRSACTTLVQLSNLLLELCLTVNQRELGVVEKV